MEKERFTMPGMISMPKFEEYKEYFKKWLKLEKRDNGILIATMHKDGKELAWNTGMRRALGFFWRTVSMDSTVELVILTNEGNKWVKDMDFEPDSFEHEGEGFMYEHYYLDDSRLQTSLIQDIDVPTIAAIGGSGFHMELGCFCDITLIADDAVMYDDHFLNASPPGDGCGECLIQLLGVKRAAYALYTGQKFTAQELVELGLANEAVPREHLLERALELAEQILKQPRMIRRLTVQIIKKTWKELLAKNLMFGLATELYGLAATAPDEPVPVGSNRDDL